MHKKLRQKFLVNYFQISLFRSCFCLDTGNRYKFSDKVTAELEQTAEYDLSLGLYKPFKFARQALLRILWSTALHVDNLFYDLIFKVFMMVLFKNFNAF